MRRAISTTMFALAVSVSVSSQPPAQPTPPPIIDHDTFHFVSLEHEKPVIDSFARYLQLEPERRGYVIAYGGRVSCRGEAQRILALIKGHLVGEHKIDEGRVVTVDGGYRESTTFYMWGIPPGEAAPTPAPVFDVRQVKFLREGHARCRGLRKSPAKPRRA